MTTPVAERLLEAYRTRLAHGARPGRDELVAASGVRSAQHGVGEAIDQLGLSGLRGRAELAHRHAEDDGITYGSRGTGGQGRDWPLDPLPVIVDRPDWDHLVSGLRQRLHLLDLVLSDVYGDRRLLHSRVLPAEVVLGHPGFLRPVDGIRLPSARQLVLAACDVVRNADGWCVLTDRTQAPSGAGYAMADRRIITRVMAELHRRTDLSRLRGFFHTMSEALMDLSPPSAEGGRGVLLTPGAGSETAFDQAFMATLLGFPLVESDDLTVREGRVYLRTTGRLVPVSVIYRRVDEDWSDPLELRPESRLGVPGLIEAARRGSVSVANPIGAGVLENPGLLHFLPGIARAFLGEDLSLPSPTSFWCGDDTDRRHVLARLESLILKPLARGVGQTTHFGWDLSGAAAADLRRRIGDEPWNWCAQEPVEMSTAPVASSSALEPRRMVLRTFAVARAGEYVVMPGALGRVASDADSFDVSTSGGAVAKDVWVPADPAERPGERRPALLPGPAALRGIAGALVDAGAGVAPRVAEDLFWLGRYTERAEGTGRLLRVADDLSEDHAARPGTPGAAALDALLHAATQVTDLQPTELAGSSLDTSRDLLRLLVLDADTPGSVAFAVERLVGAAHEVRDQMSLDTWMVLGRLERLLASRPDTSEQPLQHLLGQILEGLLAFAGIVANGMIRDLTWAFLDAGIRIERALHTVSLLRHTVAFERPPVIDGQVTESVLLAADSVITHRRRTAVGIGPASPSAACLALLLLDRTNPRSVIFSLDQFGLVLEQIGDDEAAQSARKLVTRLAEVDPDEVSAGDRSDMVALLDDLHADAAGLAAAVEESHFARKAPQRAQLSGWTLAKDGSQTEGPAVRAEP